MLLIYAFFYNAAATYNYVCNHLDLISSMARLLHTRNSRNMNEQRFNKDKELRRLERIIHILHTYNTRSKALFVFLISLSPRTLLIPIGMGLSELLVNGPCGPKVVSAPGAILYFSLHAHDNRSCRICSHASTSRACPGPLGRYWSAYQYSARLFTSRRRRNRYHARRPRSRERKLAL